MVSKSSNVRKSIVIEFEIEDLKTQRLRRADVIQAPRQPTRVVTG
jgi:hypothetical protein